MLEKETPTEATEFMLSDEGINFLKLIYREDRKNNFIAKVGYVRINGRNRELWQELKTIGEFTLWELIRDLNNIMKTRVIICWHFIAYIISTI